MVSVAVRSVPLELVATAYSTETFPTPEAGDVIVSQSALDEADHRQPGGVVRPAEPVPPPEPNVADDDESAKLHDVPT